ncbi:MAG: thioredoxin fold domain-containing protein [Alphaproteobacteria bacterium]|nr:thioredoxin fold domain-containing protein [Alphaproteobacteria bacterium]
MLDRAMIALAAPRFLVALALWCVGAAVHGQPAAPEPQDIPAWFSETFLDFREDLRDAAARGKRLMVYFGQDGCPYCRELMQNNFSQKDIADKTRRHFDAIALNIYGDREVTWVDAKVRPEKEFAAQIKVQFTPTLLFLDERGNVLLRLNGYYPPHRFRAALDWVTDRSPARAPFAEYLRKAAPEAANPGLNEQPFFAKPPYRLKRAANAKPLAVLFEHANCANCDEMHAKGFADPAVKALLRRFEVVRLPLFGRDAVLTPQGKASTAAEWARELGVAYSPSLVFFDAGGREVFRVEAYVRPFHLASSLDYVASGAYRTQPSFQRFVRERADALREKGGSVELWR